ncbi:hypothetical protein CEXT_56901 [Caerostris extrusa]|uniref:Uncharacterized protein n=1 Tax=Caerostris extrusa TaxID=172846 RepID=A0AAV4YDK6_CAEEX|nr:hypothetical protein CEXT_56901 [Caerostris extrusa]
MSRLCNYYLRDSNPICGLYCSRCFQKCRDFCTYANTFYLRFEPIMGCTAVAVFRLDEIMQLQSEIKSTCGFYCRRCFQKFGLCTYAKTILDSNPLMGYFAVAVFRHYEIMHLLITIRYPNPLQLLHFQKCRDYARLQTTT